MPARELAGMVTVRVGVNEAVLLPLTDEPATTVAAVLLIAVAPDAVAVTVPVVATAPAL